MVRIHAPGHAKSRLGQRLRVALLTPTLVMGGAERWMVSLARCCDRERIEWTGTALSDGAPASAELCREMSAFMPVYAGPGAGPAEFSPYVTYCDSAKAALTAALARADVLVTWGVPCLADLTGRFDRPVVLVSHGSGEWGLQTVRTSEAGATHFVAVSEAALEPFTPSARKVATVIHNGIDVERCTPNSSREHVRKAWGFSDHHRVIGYIGRYSCEKNPGAAAQAAIHLAGDYRAVYCGEGWIEDCLRQQVREMAGGRAKFVPMDRQVGNALSAIDVFVLASPTEGFSLSMTEAWYCGVPVVATRVGALPELERLYGPLVSPVPVDPSPEELGRAVENALTDRFREEVVTKAREVVCAHYTARAMARRWTDYLLSLTG
jgi:glycosyltransferase involved in cell wall biosynthesis